jgi:hypothetical protein
MSTGADRLGSIHERVAERVAGVDRGRAARAPEHDQLLRARATVEPSEGAWDLLDRLTKVYMSPDDEFPAPKGPGYIARYEIERIGGVGPWVQKPSG